MRRALAAFAVATLCVLGAAGASSAASHDLPSADAPAVDQAAPAVRVAAVAVPAPRPVLPFLGAFVVLVATALSCTTVLGFVARRLRRATLVPVLASTVRRRGPPALRRHR
jgi:hypothetical protein